MPKFHTALFLSLFLIAGSSIANAQDGPAKSNTNRIDPRTKGYFLGTFELVGSLPLVSEDGFYGALETKRKYAASRRSSASSFWLDQLNKFNEPGMEKQRRVLERLKNSEQRLSFSEWKYLPKEFRAMYREETLALIRRKASNAAGVALATVGLFDIISPWLGGKSSWGYAAQVYSGMTKGSTSEATSGAPESSPHPVLQSGLLH